MSGRTVAVVFLSIVCGLASAFGVKKLASSPGEAPTVPTTPVVVLTAEVPRGTIITKEHLKVLQWPQDLVPPGAIAKPEEVEGRAALSRLLANEPMLDGKLAARDAGAGMAALVKPGMRGFTILTPTIASGVAGFIMPGNKVDVLMTVTDRSYGSGETNITGGASTATLLQLVSVLAVDQHLEATAEQAADSNSLKSVTLEVTPEQASLLTLAGNKGTLHLALRNDGDDAATDVQPVTLRDLPFLQQMPLEEPETEVAQTTEQVAAPAPAEPLLIRVRTLRNRQSGDVYLQVRPSTPASRTTPLAAVSRS
ncbi:MAG: Flp pilus assembly protein CpaB [Planctomycetaceae bacterium]